MTYIYLVQGINDQGAAIDYFGFDRDAAMARFDSDEVTNDFDVVYVIEMLLTDSIQFAGNVSINSQECFGASVIATFTKQ